MRRKGKIVLYDIVMTSFYERLFELLDEGKKLVLPTEQAARAVLVSYVRARGKAIEASSVIAFDKFKDVMFPREHGAHIRLAGGIAHQGRAGAQQQNGGMSGLLHMLNGQLFFFSFPH